MRRPQKIEMKCLSHSRTFFSDSLFLPSWIPLPVQGEGKRAWRARVRAVATSTSLSTPCVKTGFVPKLLSPKVRAQAVENLFFNSLLQTLAVPERFFLPERVSARAHRPRGRRRSSQLPA